MNTLLDLMETFSPRGEKPAFIHRTGVRRYIFTYGMLAELSLRMNSLLAARGVGEGDRVVLWGPNSPWWCIAFWGIIARGAVVVPVDFMSGSERAETIARLTSTRLVIQSRMKPERVTGSPSVFLEDLEYLLPGHAQLPAITTIKPDETAQLIYTSGTTGNPKGVILTHGNLMANLRQVNQHLPVVTDEFSFLSLLPLSHMFEQMGGFLTPLFRGGTVIYLRTLKPSAIMEALAEEDVQVVIAVPRLLQLLKSSIEREVAAKGMGNLFNSLLRLSQRIPRSLRKILFFPVQRKFGSRFVLFVSGGAALPPDLFQFWSSLGFVVVEGYGLTESSPVLCANTFERQVPGSVGYPLPGVTVRLEDKEIVVSGPNIFPGYYLNEEATREAFTADGWFRTGDLGEFDDSGCLHIKGRSKELIVTGAGINVYPDEIESILNRVRGVRESCVIGLDRGGGEEVHAVLLLDETDRRGEDIVAEANASLDELHRINGFTVWGEAEFPKTTTLKIKKFQVRDTIRKSETTGPQTRPADRLSTIVAQVTGAAPGTVRDDSYLVADLGLTSIGRLELVNVLEQEFRLDLEESLIGPQTRVADLRRMIERREKPLFHDRFRFWTNTPFVRVLRMSADALLHYPLFRIFVTLEVSGTEHLAGVKGPVLFVANHMSYLDQPAVMFSLLREWRYRTATAAWAEFFFRNFRTIPQRIWKEFTYQYGSLFLNLFPLPQTDGFRRSLTFMGRLADNGINILVFPEGERSPDGTLRPFRQGLGIMVKELSLPVVPVTIGGLEKVLPRGGHWPRRGKVTVHFGKPLVFRDEDPAQIVEIARQAIVKTQRKI